MIFEPLYVDQIARLLVVLVLVLVLLPVFPLDVVPRVLVTGPLLPVRGTPLVVLVEDLGGDAVEQLLRVDAQQGPREVQ